MSLPSVASESNAMAASRRAATHANRADDAPAQSGDSFASALDQSAGGGDTPAPASEPAPQPAPPAQSDQTNSAKSQPASPTPSDVAVSTATLPPPQGTPPTLDVLAVLAGVQASPDGKTSPDSKTGDEKTDHAAADASAAPAADSSVPVPVAVLIPVPLVSSAPASTSVDPEVQAGTAGIAAAGATASLPEANASATASAAAVVAGAITAQGTPEPAVPGAALATAASLALPAGLDPKTAALLATGRATGNGKPAVRTATDPARNQTASTTQATATSGDGSSSGGSLVAAAQVQGNSSDPKGGDTGTRKGLHGEADADATVKASTEPNALRAGAAATALLSGASAPLTAHGSDPAPNLGAAAQAVAPLAASASQTPAIASPQAAQIAASYVPAVPISGLAAEITAQVRGGKNRFEIRLDPPELGRIDVRLDVDKQGQVTSHLVVERSETLDLLKRDAPSLERALQSAGLKTDGGVEFSLRDQSRQQSAQYAPPTPVLSPLPDDELAPVAAAQRSYWRLSGPGSGVDISV